MNPSLSSTMKCESTNNVIENIYKLRHLKVTFRQVLTMLSLFDTIFISSAFVSFSLPTLSTTWKVKEQVIYWNQYILFSKY